MPDELESAGPALLPIAAPPSLSDRVYETLKAGILDQRFGPGAKLSVPRLARQLGVSRTPVKEAIERLEQEGLVTSLPNRGAFVAIVRQEDIREIYELREVLEGLATRLAAVRVDDTLLRTLENLIVEGEGVVRRGDIAKHARVDLEFHRLIRERAGNIRLIRMLNNLQDQIRLVLRTSASIPGRMPKAIAEHRQILEALRARDPERAEGAARRHVALIREAVLAHLAAREGVRASTPPGGR